MTEKKNTGQETNTVNKKPFYKRKWFWAIVIVVALAALGGGAGSAPDSSAPLPDSDKTDPEVLSESDLSNISNPDGGSLQENLPAEAENDNADNGIRDESLNGRGHSDSGRSEPQYENVIGYAVIPYSDYGIKETDECLETPWVVPTYEKDKQFYAVSGSIDHKTEVLVKSQELEHEGWGSYSGYLIVERIEDGNQFCINVGNFITKPYWSYDDISESASVGYCIAEFNQISNYYPVTKDNKKVDLDDGTLVLVVGNTGLYAGDGPDRDINSIEAIVFKEWQYGYGGVSVFFNAQDLSITY